MGATLDARGLKRICTSCGTRFYDMKKRPIICPNCSVEFTGEIKVKARRGRLPAAEAEPVKATKVAANDESIEVEAEADTVSLEDVKDMEAAAEGEEDIDLPEGELEDLEEIEDDLEDDLEDDIDIKPAGEE